MEKMRIKWLDSAKGLCMLFVVFSHTYNTPGIIGAFYKPFFLATFFFVTGYTLKPDFSLEIVKKKAKSLLLPWICFSIIDIGLVSIFGNGDTGFIKRFLYNLMQVKGFYDSLWFLPCTFIISLSVMYLLKHLDFKLVVVIMTILTVLNRIYVIYTPQDLFFWNVKALPWHIHLIGPVGLIMLFGHYISKKDETEIFEIKKYGGICIVIYIILISFLYIKKDISVDIFGIGTVEWALIILLGIVSSITISMILQNNRVLEYIGRNSLYYFCIHVIFAKILNKIMEHIVFKIKIISTVEPLLPIIETLILLIAVWCALKILRVIGIIKK